MAEKIIAVNRQAHHEYHIEATFEAGIVLVGTELKSLRAGRVSLREAFAKPERGELFLLGMHIPQYQPGGPFNHEPTRPRKLLLHRYEIREIASKVAQKGLTVVPLRLYFNDGRVKVELGLAQGKTLHDKRQAISKREAQREMERAHAPRNRG